MVAESPVELSMLAQLLELPPAKVEELCEELAEEYRRQRRGFVLSRIAGGYRFQSDPELASYIERFVLEGQSARLSGAALESLAIVAYKQPVLARPGGFDQGCQFRRSSEDFVPSRLRLRSRARPWSRPSGPVRDHHPVAREARSRPGRGPPPARGVRARPRGYGCS